MRTGHSCLAVRETRSDSTHRTRYWIDFANARSMPPISICYDRSHCSGHAGLALDGAENINLSS